MSKRKQKSFIIGNFEYDEYQQCIRGPGCSYLSVDPYSKDIPNILNALDLVYRQGIKDHAKAMRELLHIKESDSGALYHDC